MVKQIIVSMLVIFSSSILAEQDINRVHINGPITWVYDYITQPDQWHDWVLQSKSANTPGGSLIKGQRFSEVVMVGEKDVEFQHQVTHSRPPESWGVAFTSESIVGHIHYQLYETIDGTVMTRTLEYFAKPENAEEQRSMVKLANGVKASSIRSLRNLKRKLESNWSENSSQ